MFLSELQAQKLLNRAWGSQNAALTGAFTRRETTQLTLGTGVGEG